LRIFGQKDRILPKNHVQTRLFSKKKYNPWQVAKKSEDLQIFILLVEAEVIALVFEHSDFLLVWSNPIDFGLRSTFSSGSL